MNDGVRKSIYFLIILLVLTSLYPLKFVLFNQKYFLTHPLYKKMNIKNGQEVIPGKILDRNNVVLAKSSKKENEEYFREYYLGFSGSHIIGYNSRIYGEYGFERKYRDYLLGRNFITKVKNFINKLEGKRARGNNLITTLDAKLQKLSYKLLDEKKGAVVALQPYTGEVLVCVSSPGFNPNNLNFDWKKLKKLDGVFFNRALKGRYPPGSTFKTLIAAVALEENFSFDKRYFCNGYKIINGRKINCIGRHGFLDMGEALQKSCNSYFIELAQEIGNDKLYYYISQFLNVEEFSLEQLPGIAIGQDKLLLSPIQLASIYATIANEGRYIKPFFVKKITDSDGNTIRKQLTPKTQKIFSTRTCMILKKLLAEVVEKGTGKKAKIYGLSVAGKTGTAENPHGEPHGWFVCFAPVNHPEIVVVVIIENGGYGGLVAAPVAKKILLEALGERGE